jgi:hypothetical protein
MAEISVAPLNGRTCSSAETQENTAFLTCPRCLRWAWIRDGAGLNRCINCGMPQRYAICECGNGLAAHGPRGCEGIADDGNPCECQRRRTS